MTYDLTTEQQEGIEHNALHNGLSIDGYITRLITKDANRGLIEKRAGQLVTLTTKLIDNPSEIAKMEVLIDAKIEESKETVESLMDDFENILTGS